MLVWFIIPIQRRWEQESPWGSLSARPVWDHAPPPVPATHTYTYSVVHLWTDTWDCPLATTHIHTQMHMGTPPHISTHPRTNKSDSNSYTMTFSPFPLTRPDCSFLRRQLVFGWTNFHSLGTLVHVHTDGSFCQYLLMDVKNFLGGATNKYPELGMFEIKH